MPDPDDERPNESERLEWRTRCLKLAADTVGSDPDRVLATAERYWAFIKGWS